MNEGTWDLSVFYQDFDDPALRGDIDAIRAAAEGMENLLAQDRPEADRPGSDGLLPGGYDQPFDSRVRLCRADAGGGIRKMRGRSA